MELKKIDDKAKFVEAYHDLEDAFESFGRLTPNINRNFRQIIQNIYGRLDNAQYHVFVASNNTDIDIKKDELFLAKQDIFYTFSSFSSLVKAKGMSIGAANEVISRLKKAYDGVCKWYSYCKGKGNEQ